MDITPKSLPVKFHPPKSFHFPKRLFGTKLESRSFQSEWCEKFDWLHYDISCDAAFCYLCMSTEFENKFLESTKRAPAFITTGFTSWKDAMSAFNKHSGSACHSEAIMAIEVLPVQFHDIGELLNTQHEKDKSVNGNMFLRILQNIRFLARQGLALRGHDGGEDSNFSQLLLLRSFDCPEVTQWMHKKANTYCSPEIQNECLRLMALHILRKISFSISTSGFYTIMADECTNVANKERFVVCIRWVDDSFIDHEDVIGLYLVGTIDADSLVKSIKDVLLRMNLKIAQCRGQCYDGAANMTGNKRGVATQSQTEEGRAILTHCYGHALNLAVCDTMKQSKVCRDALDIAFEVNKLIRFSPKRNAAFERIKVENATSDDELSGGIRALCPTRWTVRGDAIESIIDNYFTLHQLWDECLDAKLVPDIKARIIGVKTQMSRYFILFGLCLCKTVLKITDNLSRILQKHSLSAAEGQSLAELTVKTLKGMRNDEGFTLFFSLVMQLTKETNTDEPVLPRKRRAPREFGIVAEPFHSITIEEYYRSQYFEVIDLAIFGITQRFNQPGYVVYKNLESLLVKAANKQEYRFHFEQVVSFYSSDIKPLALDAQLNILGTHFQSEIQESVSLQDCIDYLRSLSAAQRSFYSEVCCIARLILIMPSTNAVSERSFSSMRRLKTYLRSATGQARLNHLIILNINKEKLDSLDLDIIANDFVQGSEHRLKILASFSQKAKVVLALNILVSIN